MKRKKKEKIFTQRREKIFVGFFSFKVENFFFNWIVSHSGKRRAATKGVRGEMRCDGGLGIIENELLSSSPPRPHPRLLPTKFSVER